VTQRSKHLLVSRCRSQVHLDYPHARVSLDLSCSRGSLAATIADEVSQVDNGVGWYYVMQK